MRMNVGTVLLYSRIIGFPSIEPMFFDVYALPTWDDDFSKKAEWSDERTDRDSRLDDPCCMCNKKPWRPYQVVPR